MARHINRLTPRGVVGIKSPGLHADGAGLYLQVSPSGSKSWSFIYHWRGRRRQMGLGSLLVVTLAEAREAADVARRMVFRDINPLDERKKANAGGNTFGEVADQLLASLAPEWKSEKHAYQWTYSLTVEAASLRDIDIDRITTDDVLAVLKPIWSSKPETASRCRGRIERVLDAAKAKGLRTGDNPARWKGHLATLLPKRQKLTRGHHPAMPFDEVAGFMRELKSRTGLAARALEMTILTACRTGEVIGARISELDLAKAVWVIPAGRMKAQSEHRVPLTQPVVSLLKSVIAEQREAGLTNDFVFADAKGEKPISNMAMNMLLRRMGEDTVTVHGFRSSFRDWAGETTSFPREIIEGALAHQVGNEVERAYRRGDALEKRRALMVAWADYCAEPMSKSLGQAA